MDGKRIPVEVISSTEEVTVPRLVRVGICLQATILLFIRATAIAHHQIAW